VSKKKEGNRGPVLKAWAKEPKEDWNIFIHERMSAKGTAASGYRLTTWRDEATRVVRDLVFARAYKSRHNVVGKLYRKGWISPIPVYACRATRDKKGAVVVRKSPEGKMPPLA
jgi:hypothetical protein